MADRIHYQIATDPTCYSNDEFSDEQARACAELIRDKLQAYADEHGYDVEFELTDTPMLFGTPADDDPSEEAAIYRELESFEVNWIDWVMQSPDIWALSPECGDTGQS